MPRLRAAMALSVAGAVTAAMVAACGSDDRVGDGRSELVLTADGPVRGSAEPGFRVFRAIPYAAGPVGSLRWQPPVAPEPWTAVRDATRPGPRCIQDTRLDPDYGLATSEDCLSLTVWTPDGAAPRAPRPVMVWIHGGGFLNGSSDLYDARRLTNRGDIVVVTVNYRLGALGFLAHPALAVRGSGDAVGNYGLADQQAALRWVRDNIAQFGGDPGRVTIAGESAGAISVCDHLVAPESRGLFRAAIMQSGPCHAQADLTTAERVSMAYAAGLGCPDAATAGSCLAALPAERLQGGPAYVRFGGNLLSGPVTGTARLPFSPAAAAARGETAPVPVLVGTTADEFTLFVALSYLRDRGLDPYPQLLADTFGSDAAAVAVQYPPDRFGGNAALAYATAVTDGIFACPVDAVAHALARRAPVYAYEFNDRFAPAPDPVRAAPLPIGAAHGLELRYLFDMGGTPPLDRAQQQLSGEMIDYWARFVTTGSPDVPGAPEWPPLRAGESERMSLQTGRPELASDFTARHRCDFWQSRG